MKDITSQNIQTLVSLIEKSERIAIVGHMKPDGDALGSCMGMYHYLSLYGKSENEVPVKDTLFSHREHFVIDSLAFIPFCGDSIIMASTVKRVSGVNVPLFEASMPYKSLLKGLNNQLRINLDAQCEDQGKYKGLQVGSISAPNNNAGNWE